MKTHQGSCLCKAVKFEAEVDASKGSRCNCTFCSKISATSTIVKPNAFRVVAGEDNLAVYANSIGGRYFCKTCGLHCFGRGTLQELGGEYVSVYLNCLADIDLAEVELSYWDGRHNNWQAGLRATPWPVHSVKTNAVETPRPLS